MSSNIELKLKYSHSLIQCQGVEQILQKIKNAHGKTGNNNSYANEVELLWNYCCSGENKFVGNLCAEALLSLVQDGILNSNIVLKTAVNYTASSLSPDTLIILIHKLLLGKVMAAQKLNESNWKLAYKLRSPPHPFISAMISNSRCIPAIYSIISNILSRQKSEENESSPGMDIMLNFVKPSLIYICEDNAKVEYPLINVVRCMCSNNSTEMHLKIVYCILIAKDITLATFDSYLYFVETLTNSSIEDKNDYMAWAILIKVFGYIKKSVDYTLSHKLISNLHKWIDYKMVSSPYLSVLIMHLSNIISSSSIEIILSTCTFLYKVLKFYDLEWMDQYIAMLLLQSALINLTLLVENIILRHAKLSVLKLLQIVETKLENYVVSHDEKQRNFSNCLQGLQDSYTVEMVNHLRLFCNVISSPISFKSLIGSCKRQINYPQSYTQSFCILLLHGIKDNFSEESFANLTKYVVIYSKAYPDSALNFSPIILHCLKNCKNGEKNLALLYTLPSIVHHHSSLPIVLNAIKQFATVESMLPLSIRLLVDLWKLHDRCFPTLQKLIITSNLKMKNVESLAKVQCIAIREICKTRPHKYASEMIQLITSILNLSNKKSVEAAIAVDALYLLCEFEALDIVSTWNTLLKNIWAKSEGLVSAAILRVLSLTEKLNVDTVEYKEFKSTILTIIWYKIEHKNAIISSAALKTLSYFNPSDFIIAHLPLKFKPQQKSENDEVIEEDLPIPGSCYFNIFLSLSPSAVKGFETFYRSILHYELSEMPRDIKHRAMRQQRNSMKPMFMNDIPEYILRMYERNKLPSLKPNLALALLISHNPVNPLGSDGKVIYRMSLSRGKSFFKLMITLLGEISLDPNDWQSLLWVAKGWEIFMERCLKAMINGRKAELEMQLEHNGGDPSSSLSTEEVEEIQNKQHYAHLSCRDQIMHELTAASKGNPAKQGNSVIALAGLASACINVEKQQNQSSDDEVHDSTYVSNKHWVTKVADTLMCIADAKFKPPGRIFSWCQYNAVSKTGRLSTTQLGRICAFHGFVQMLNALFPKHNVKVLNMLDLLMENAFPSPLPSSGKDVVEDRSCHISRHSSIVLGQFLGIIVKEKCENSLGPEAKKMLDVSLSNFLREVTQYDPDRPNASNCDETGVIVGLGYFLSSIVYFSEDTNEKNKALEVLSKIKEQLENSECDSQYYTNALCFTMSLLCSSGTSTTLLSKDISSNCLTLLMNIHKQEDQQLGIAQALGTLANSLFFSGKEDIIVHILTLYSKWSNVISDSKSSMRAKTAALIGISCLAGSSNSLLPATQNPELLTNTQYNNMLNSVIKIIRMAAGNQTNNRLQAIAIPLISQMALSYESVSEAQSQMVPTSYSYLPDTSVLKYTFSFLQECVKNSNRVDSKIPNMILCVISELCQTLPLPPINFALQLSQFDQIWKSEDFRNKCLLIAVSQSSKSPTAVAYVSKWISTPVFNDLPISTKILLYSKLNILSSTQPVSKVEALLSWGVKQIIAKNENNLIYAILSSVKDCLKLKDNSNVQSPFSKSIEEIYNNLEFDTSSVDCIKLWCIIAECLSFHGDANEIVERWKNSKNSEDYQQLVLKALFTRCYCTSIGLHPLSLCNDIIEECAKLDLDHQKKSLWIIATTLCNLKHISSKVNKQIEWMQEIMGFIKQFTIKSNSESGSSILYFMLRVFATLVICWQEENYKIGVLPITCEEFSCMKREQLTQLWDKCPQLLSTCLPELLGKEAWGGVSALVIEWLIILHKNIAEELNSNEYKWHDVIKQSICCCRHLNAYHRPSIWMEAANILHSL